MSFAERFEDLKIWNDARLQVVAVYQMTKDLRDYGFKEQVQRAAISVMNNISEGFERRTSKDFSHFLNIAKASCGEVRSMLYIAEDLNYLNRESATELREKSEKLSKMIASFSRSLK